jgi:DNA-binding SARP family transcriptional activator
VAHDHYEAALRLYTGPYLAGVDDPAVAHERLRLQGLAYGAACRQAELLAAKGEPEAALQPAAAGVRIDSFGERAYRVMIGCHLALGAKDAARATAELLESQVAAAGSTPEPETRRVLSNVQR